MEAYFVANPKPEAAQALCTFRVSGKAPALWHPDTGRIEPAGAWEVKGGRTSLPLRFDPNGSPFVVFGESAGGAPQAAGGKNWLEFAPGQAIRGPWNVDFDPKWGGPARPVAFAKLEDWSKRPEPAIRFYLAALEEGRSAGRVRNARAGEFAGGGKERGAVTRLAGSGYGPIEVRPIA